MQAGISHHVVTYKTEIKIILQLRQEAIELQHATTATIRYARRLAHRNDKKEEQKCPMKKTYTALITHTL